MKCATHPDVETNLTCSKCGKPICPKCLVQTPVGARCRDCAQLTRLPTYHVSASYYLRAGLVAFGMAIVCGIVWGLINEIIGLRIPLSINLLLAPAFGYAIGEVISLATNRKRGTGLAVVGSIAVVISYAITILIAILFTGGFYRSLFMSLYDLAALGLGIYVTTTRLR
jgi:hypothetical protein